MQTVHYSSSGSCARITEWRICLGNFYLASLFRVAHQPLSLSLSPHQALQALSSLSLDLEHGTGSSRGKEAERHRGKTRVECSEPCRFWVCRQQERRLSCELVLVNNPIQKGG